MQQRETAGTLDCSGVPFRARLALALAVLFASSAIELPVKLPPMNRATRRRLARSASATPVSAPSSKVTHRSWWHL